MTTETQQVDAAEVYRSIGRLEGEVAQLGARLEREVSHLVARLDRIEQRLDRLIFALFAFGGIMGAALAAIIVKLFLGS